MVAFLSSWPWENFGVYKYLLYGPLVAKVIHTKAWEGGSPDAWCFHILILFALRGVIHQLWCSFSNMLCLTRRRRIIKEGIDFKQIDKEWDWDNFLILQAFIGAMACYLFPSLKGLPKWDMRGVLAAFLIHVGVSEPLFYWAHRFFFHKDKIFSLYHSMHHSTLVPQSFTAGFATPLEHLVLSLVMGAPILGAALMGLGSVRLVYGYVLVFDFLRCMGYCNVEVFSHVIFQAFPLLRYLIYTPTYHSLHHTEKNKNFCLFMPLFDALGGTIHSKSWELQREISSGNDDRVPDYVFLAHVVDVISSLHVHFVFRSFASIPFTFQPFLLVMWPPAFIMMLIMWAWSKTFLVSFYHIHGRHHQIWVVPRYGFQYFLPFTKDGINDQIELAILRADKMGVKVLSLAALNKNEALNGGGTLFVSKHPELKVRVAHGNTLTAAVILNEIPKDVEEVFLTGATSKLGRAIALYLSRKKIRVLMLTLSTERFQNIQKESPQECQEYLVQVTKYQAAQNCKYTLDRGVVHACHAGGVVHSLEGWTHHEVGAIDVDRIDIVWKAALKHGITPV